MDKLSIKQIRVEKLFGYYTYNIKPENFGTVCENLLVFYGDNGSGKTTILRLIFFLLSTKYQSGFKSEISKIKFKKFALRFTNDIEIGAERKNTILGSYSFYIKQGGKITKQVQLKAREDLSINLANDETTELKYKQILVEIEALGIRVFYLSDQRKLYNSITSTISEDQSDNDINPNKIVERIRKKKNIDLYKYSVDAALEKFAIWVNEQIIVSSKIGERNTNNIYIDIANSVLRNRKSKTDAQHRTDQIKNLIDEISLRSNEFASLGLINPVETKELTDALKKAKSEKLLTITAILEPFIEGIKARLDALEILKNTIQRFLYHINIFFSKKNITFTLSEGFDIRQEQSGEQIKLDHLSSGERQLILLFANTVTSTDQATFFIIDEPEISLNIKWQRMLISSLLDLSQNSKVQFLLATHSFELLSAQPECVVKLEEKK